MHCSIVSKITSMGLLPVARIGFAVRVYSVYSSGLSSGLYGSRHEHFAPYLSEGPNQRKIRVYIRTIQKNRLW